MRFDGHTPKERHISAAVIDRLVRVSISSIPSAEVYWMDIMSLAFPSGTRRVPDWLRQRNFHFGTKMCVILYNVASKHNQ